MGPKGATIKRIQQQTHTYIVTPSRDKEPVFEVTGTPENADQARKEIESHIALRTGGGLLDQPPPNGANGNPPGGTVNGNLNVMSHSSSEDALNQLNDFHSNGVDSGLLGGGCQGELSSNDLYSSMYDHHCNKNLQSNHHPLHSAKGVSGSSGSSAFTAYNSNNTSSSLSHSNQSSIFTFPPTGAAYSQHHHQHHHHPNPLGSASSTHSNGFVANGYGFYDNGTASSTSNGSLDIDDASLTSPVFGDVTSSLSIGGSVWSDVTHDVTPPLGGGVLNLPVFTTGVNLPMRSNSYACASTTPRLSPVLTDSASALAQNGVAQPHVSLRRLGSDPMTTGHPLATHLGSSGTSGPSAAAAMSNGSGSPTLSSNSSSSGCGGSSFGGGAMSMVSLSESSSSSPTDSSGSSGAGGPGPLSGLTGPLLSRAPGRGAAASNGGSRNCLVCGDGDIVAAFVPCGHNLFCMDCANGIMERPEFDRRCPVCQLCPSQAIRILFS